MTNLNKQELLQIEGGGISAAMITAILKGISSLFELGRSLGTSIRRMATKNICPL